MKIKSLKSKAKVFLTIVVFWGLAVFLSGCTEEKFYTKDFFAMDTWMSVQIAGDFSEEEMQKHLSTIEARIRELENIFSVTLQGSDLYRVNNYAGETITIENKDFINILSEALSYEQLTDRAFSPRLYKISREWGFTTGNYKVPEDFLIKSYLEEIDASEIFVTDGNVIKTNGVMLDFGAIAKGYATDCIVEYIKENDIPKAIINLGGNVYVHGSRDENTGWSVGIADPFADRLLGIIDITDACVVTSGNYERYFEQNGVRYNHIIDSQTGYPAENSLASVTIISTDASYADALSTALFVMGTEKAIDFWKNNAGFEFILVTEDKEIYYSNELDKEGIFNSNEEIFSDRYVLRPVGKAE